MALELRRRRPVKVPPWFWIWRCPRLDGHRPGHVHMEPANTIAGTNGGRIISIGVSLAEYAAATITLLFVG